MTTRTKPEKIRCDACPVMCYIADGKSGACDRYANHGGELVRLDPLTIIEGTDQKLVPFMGSGNSQDDWNGDLSRLQARPLYREPGCRGRRHGHGRDRRHL